MLSNILKSKRTLFLGLLFVTLILLIITYRALTKEALATGLDSIPVWWLIAVNIILLMAISFLLISRIARLFSQRKRGFAGPRLQTRMIVIFSLVTLIPAIIIAAFSATFFKFGIQSWFDQKVGTAIEESVAVAQSYLIERKENIRGDILAMAKDLERDSYLLIQNQVRFNQIVETQAALRNLSEAIVFQRDRVLAQSSLSFSLAFEYTNIPEEVLSKANDGEVVILTSDNDTRVRALIKLDNLFDTYLLVGQHVDSKIIAHTEKTKGSVHEYNRLKSNISALQTRFFYIFIATALLLLLFAAWFGILIAAQFVNPISQLVEATERVKEGDLTARVDEAPVEDELTALASAFNGMTDQLERQRNELIEVNQQIDNRRRFIETVLSGVSAGVISINKLKKINLMNDSALNMLNLRLEDIKYQPANEIFPEINSLIAQAEEKIGKTLQDEITIFRGDKRLVLLVRITAQAELGFIVTFDDVTEIQAAHKSKAWSDVAQRVAHEIKNPLTPIHLAAERLKKKYANEITSDQDNFLRYINTIIRHVGDIGKMVEEFVTFGRMPNPKFTKCDLSQLLRDAVFSRQCASPDIEFKLNLPDESLWIEADPSQISQVLTNVLKNAEEAIMVRKELDIKGKIDITLEVKNMYQIQIKDNGIGLPEEAIDKLTEPYVTMRERGTGLGLAIVKKVIEEHGGKMTLENYKKAPNNEVAGASITLYLPIRVTA